MKTTNYQQQAMDFAKKTGTSLIINSEDYKYHFPDDVKKNVYRSVYNCTLKRNGKQYTFDFGQSIANSGQEPTMYDVLTCLTKNDPGSFENFCGDFGYDEDSRTAEKIYKSVCKEWEGIERLFADVLKQLQEIL